ncbi:MAG: hypothetical protein ACC652_06455 [Acidimicrobiales bacterium]
MADITVTLRGPQDRQIITFLAEWLEELGTVDWREPKETPERPARSLIIEVAAEEKVSPVVQVVHRWVHMSGVEPYERRRVVVKGPDGEVVAEVPED